MAMRRTTVFADEDDLAAIKAEATRRGVPEAELLRDAIHLAAMAARTWDEPFFSANLVPITHEPAADVHDVAAAVQSEAVDRYERTKRRTS